MCSLDTITVKMECILFFLVHCDKSIPIKNKNSPELWLNFSRAFKENLLAVYRVSGLVLRGYVDAGLGLGRVLQGYMHVGIQGLYRADRACVHVEACETKP